MADPKLQNAAERCGEALAALEPLFADDCRLTLVMRSTTNDECFLVLSKDDLNEVIDTLLRAKAKGKDCDCG